MGSDDDESATTSLNYQQIAAGGIDPSKLKKKTKKMKKKNKKKSKKSKKSKDGEK